MIKLCCRTYILLPKHLEVIKIEVHLQCVFHSIRFKVNEDWFVEMTNLFLFYMANALNPPSTGTTTPVTKLDASLIRY
jgi:hypothetical protein